MVEQKLKEYAKATENYLEKYFTRFDTSYEDITDNLIVRAMKYSLFAGGKRIRPALTLGFCEALTGSYAEALPFAASVEMVHTYSLIHDDLPCMDNDDFRRGKLTCHKMFGEATALLAGDGLLNLSMENISMLDGYDDALKLKQMKTLSMASGVLGMIGGQSIDVFADKKNFNKEQLQKLHSLKTGKLIQASVLMGVAVANAADKQIKIADKYATNIGLAFQIIDDILDVTSTTENMGKTVGKDKDSDKCTFVTLLGVEKAFEYANELTNEAVSVVKNLPNNEFVVNLAYTLLNRRK